MIRTHAISRTTGPTCDIDAADDQSNHVKVPQAMKTAYSRNTESGLRRPLSQVVAPDEDTKGHERDRPSRRNARDDVRTGVCHYSRLFTGSSRFTEGRHLPDLVLFSVSPTHLLTTRERSTRMHVRPESEGRPRRNSALHAAVVTCSCASRPGGAVRQASSAGVCSAQSATTEQLPGQPKRPMNGRKSGKPLFGSVWSEDEIRSGYACNRFVDAGRGGPEGTAPTCTQSRFFRRGDYLQSARKLSTRVVVTPFALMVRW